MNQLAKRRSVWGRCWHAHQLRHARRCRENRREFMGTGGRMGRDTFLEAVGCAEADRPLMLGVRLAIARMCEVDPRALVPDLPTESLLRLLPGVLLGWDELHVVFHIEKLIGVKLFCAGRPPLTPFGKPVADWTGPGSAGGFGAWITDTVARLRGQVGVAVPPSQLRRPRLRLRA